MALLPVAVRSSTPRFLLLILCSLALSITAGAETKKKKAATPAPKQKEDDKFFVRVKVLSVMPDGILGSGSLRINSGQTVRWDEPIAIWGDFANVVDGDSWQGEVYLAGRYQYTATSGALKTVRAFATTPLESLRRRDPEAARVESEKLKPPFGLHWGEKKSKVELLVAGVKAKVASRERTKEREVLRVTGLLQTGLKETHFIFINDLLRGVSLVYEREGWREED